MVAKRTEKVANAEYEGAAPKKVASSKPEFRLGHPAPVTVYKDSKTGALSTEAPVVARVVVFEGNIVTPDILRQVEGL